MSSAAGGRGGLEEVLQAREKTLAALEQENMALKVRVYAMGREAAASARQACEAEKRAARECSTNRTLRAALAEHRGRERALGGEVRGLEREMAAAGRRVEALLSRVRGRQ